MVMNIPRRLAAVAFFCVLLIVGGCDVLSIREPMGQRIDMNDQSAQASKDLEAVLSHVWVLEEGDDKKVTYEFKREGGSGFEVTFTDGKNKPQVFQGFARSWDDRLIFQVGYVDQDLQLPMLACMMFKVNRDEKGALTARWYEVRKDAFKVERTMLDGKKVKLEFYESKRNAEIKIKSGETAIAAYLSACKPDDLFKLSKEAVWRGVKPEEYKAQATTQPAGQ